MKTFAHSSTLNRFASDPIKGLHTLGGRMCHDIWAETKHKCISAVKWHCRLPAALLLRSRSSCWVSNLLAREYRDICYGDVDGATQLALSSACGHSPDAVQNRAERKNPQCPAICAFPVSVAQLHVLLSPPPPPPAPGQPLALASGCSCCWYILYILQISCYAENASCCRVVLVEATGFQPWELLTKHAVERRGRLSCGISKTSLQPYEYKGALYMNWFLWLKIELCVRYPTYKSSCLLKVPTFSSSHG